MRSGKMKLKSKSSVKKTVPKKSVATKAQLEKKLLGAKSDAVGLRYEQAVANYFIRKGWSPRHRVRKYGYEYDLYAERSEAFDVDYLVVECKCKGKVSAKDIVRFINRVDAVYKHLPEQLFGEPPLYAYLCYSEDVDKDASALAKRNKPSIKLLKIER
jgi:hypothetical protein